MVVSQIDIRFAEWNFILGCENCSAIKILQQTTNPPRLKLVSIMKYYFAEFVPKNIFERVVKFVTQFVRKLPNLCISSIASWILWMIDGKTVFNLFLCHNKLRE